MYIVTNKSLKMFFISISILGRSGVNVNVFSILTLTTRDVNVGHIFEVLGTFFEKVVH